MFGSHGNQGTALRAGVEHSHAARFRAGAIGHVPRALPPPVERPFLTGRPARPARNLFGPGESPPRA